MISEAPLLDCKRAALQSNGNLNIALEFLKKSGQIRAQKKQFNKVEHGLVVACTKFNGAILKACCETDFGANSMQFVDFARFTQTKVSQLLFESRQITLEQIKLECEPQRQKCAAVLAENVAISNCWILPPIDENSSLGWYVHNSKTSFPLCGSLVSLVHVKGNKIAAHIANDFAQHMASQLDSEAPLCEQNFLGSEESCTSYLKRHEAALITSHVLNFDWSEPFVRTH